ncbi:amino acid ABC transporter permease [Achromatium sp. WMS2]|nr:amino acid ABC transporter permease [Achromatium sp. WMS2]
MLLQAVFLIVIASGCYALFTNVLANLSARGIRTGFDFLTQESGFRINQTLVNYSETSSFGRVFIVGILNTLLVSVLGIMLATWFGFLIGIARLSSNWLISRLAAVYIEIFRNIPLLLQVLFWYNWVLRVLPHPRQSHHLGQWLFLNQRGLYLPKIMLLDGSWVFVVAILTALVSMPIFGYWLKKYRAKTGRLWRHRYLVLGAIVSLPICVYLITGDSVAWELPVLKGFNFRGGVVLLPELIALLLALTIYTTAFIAEIVRAGIQAVPKGQIEAASALGFSLNQRLTLIVIPQALRVIIPPLTNQYLNLLKNSSLATAIGYPDLVNVFAGTTVNITGQAIEVIAMTMAVYLIFSLLISLLMNIYNRLVALVER